MRVCKEGHEWRHAICCSGCDGCATIRAPIPDLFDFGYASYPRKRYNAQQVLARFPLPREETDLDALTPELVRVVQETMQPEGMSVWLKKRTSVHERRWVL